MRTAMNQRLLISNSRGDSNRYPPCKGKLDQHNMYASRASPRMPRVRFLRAVHVHGNLSQAINSV
jgi:pectate lyase